MTAEQLQARWLDERRDISLEELAQVSGLPADVLQELVECGVLAPAEARGTSWTFTGSCIATVRTAGRLREDFDLDASGLALALKLLDRIEELEARVKDLKARK